jgi:hypothetical protein
LHFLPSQIALAAERDKVLWTLCGLKYGMPTRNTVRIGPVPFQGSFDKPLGSK